MKIPKWLLIIIIILLLIGFAGLIIPNLSFLNECTITEILNSEGVASFSLILTLVAILFYVYFTYMLAKDTWTPSASFALEVDPKDPYHFTFYLRNHSKISISCWCNLNAIVEGKPISLGGFYGGESPFELQPFSIGRGHFFIKDILTKENCNLQSIKKRTNSSNIKEQLYLKIDFWYTQIGANKKIHNPIQPYYFDFKKDVIVLDV